MKGGVAENKTTMRAIILQALFVATALVLLIDIVRHGHGCMERTTPSHQKALEHRLKSMEDEVQQNSLVLQEIVVGLEKQFSLSEMMNLRELKRSCHDAAAVIVGHLAEDPAPPMPSFDVPVDTRGLDDRYDDDVFAGAAAEADPYTDVAVENLPSVKERTAICQDWRLQYAVSPGVSWGSLPLDLQTQWKAFDCDIYIQRAVQALIADDDDASVIGDINSVKDISYHRRSSRRRRRR